jgi:hypothetical protein
MQSILKARGCDDVLWSTLFISISLYPSRNQIAVESTVDIDISISFSQSLTPHFPAISKKSKANMKPSTDQPPSLHTPTIPHSEVPSRCRRPGAGEWDRE